MLKPRYRCFPLFCRINCGTLYICGSVCQLFFFWCSGMLYVVFCRCGVVWCGVVRCGACTVQCRARPHKYCVLQEQTSSAAATKPKRDLSLTKGGPDDVPMMRPLEGKRERDMEFGLTVDAMDALTDKGHSVPDAVTQSNNRHLARRQRLNTQRRSMMEVFVSLFLPKCCLFACVIEQAGRQACAQAGTWAGKQAVHAGPGHLRMAMFTPWGLP